MYTYYNYFDIDTNIYSRRKRRRKVRQGLGLKRFSPIYLNEPYTEIFSVGATTKTIQLAEKHFDGYNIELKFYKEYNIRNVDQAVASTTANSDEKKDNDESTNNSNNNDNCKDIDLTTNGNDESNTSTTPDQALKQQLLHVFLADRFRACNLTRIGKNLEYYDKSGLLDEEKIVEATREYPGLRVCVTVFCTLIDYYCAHILKQNKTK